MKYALSVVLLLLVAATAHALPDGEWTVDYYDEEGNHVGHKDIWCSGISSSGTVTDSVVVLYWGPCEGPAEPIPCEDVGYDWSDMPGDCGQCMSPGYRLSYNTCQALDCNGNAAPGCGVKGPALRKKPPLRASVRPSAPPRMTAIRADDASRECSR